MKIIIAYDGSTCADGAIKDLPRAGLPRQAEVLILNVQEKWLPPPSSYKMVGEVFVSSNSATAQPAREAREDEAKSEHIETLAMASERLKTFFPEWKCETLSLQGSPAREIIRQAKDRNADLIVTGSHRRTGIKRFVLGSVSQKVVNEAACSVRVVRGETRKNGSPSRLLIGLDGTDGANAAVAAAARRMWIMGSEVRLVVARDASDHDEKWVAQFVADARKTLERAELTVTELIEEGDPKQVPSGGGVGTARAVAHAYSVFATGGKELGLRSETLQELIAPAIPPSAGFYDDV